MYVHYYNYIREAVQLLSNIACLISYQSIRITSCRLLLMLSGLYVPIGCQQPLITLYISYSLTNDNYVLVWSSHADAGSNSYNLISCRRLDWSRVKNFIRKILPPTRMFSKSSMLGLWRDAFLQKRNFPVLHPSTKSSNFSETPLLS